MTEIIINSATIPIPQPTQKVFSIRITSDNEADINKLIDAIKAGVPDAAITDKRQVEVKP